MIRILSIITFILITSVYCDAQKFRDSLLKISEKKFEFDTSKLEIGFVGEAMNCKSKFQGITDPLYDLIVFEKNLDSTCNLYTIIYYNAKIKLKNRNTEYISIKGYNFPSWIKYESNNGNLLELTIYDVFIEKNNKVYRFPKNRVYTEK